MRNLPVPCVRTKPGSIWLAWFRTQDTQAIALTGDEQADDEQGDVVRIVRPVTIRLSASCSVALTPIRLAAGSSA